MRFPCGALRLCCGVSVFFFAGNCFAGQEFQTFEQNWEFGDAATADVTFEPFDNMDGARTLNSVSVGFAGDLAFEFAALNFDPVAYTENEWSMDAYLSVLFSFVETPDFPNGGPFFFIAGTQFIGLTGELSPGFGGPFDPFREPGDVIAIAEANDKVDATLTIDDDGQLAYFQSSEPLQGKLGPFTEFLLHPPAPDSFIDANLIELTQSGDFTMTYEFDLLCDLNSDDVCDVRDLDGLTGVLATSGDQDLNADGVTDLVDRDRWLETAARVDQLESSYLAGDANLDGIVDAADLNQVGLHWLDDTDRWSEGDFDGSGMVDSVDLNVLGLNWLKTNVAQPAAAQPVPEPSAAAMMLVLCAATLSQRKRSNLEAVQ